MKNENFFKNTFQSIFDYSKIVLLMFLIKNDINLLKEFGFVKSDIERLNLEFENITIEQIDE